MAHFVIVKRLLSSISSVLAVGKSDVYPATWRSAGDKCILLEYGPAETEDLNRRFRIHGLYERLQKLASPKVYCTPGVCSLQIRFNPEEITAKELVKVLVDIDASIPDTRTHDMLIPSRKVCLPIAFFDKWNKEAVQRYTRDFPKAKDMPYLPDNADFVAKANGLKNKEEIIDYVTRAPYLVLGLGDVYLGAPCAISLDPASRLTIPKYNPARTFSPEGAVGLGGSYLCIYPMESPGGYQLIGRTIPIWNLYMSNPSWQKVPWLLRYFDQIIFNQVNENELEAIRSDVTTGKYQIKIEETEFSTKKYNDDFKKRKKQIENFQTMKMQKLQAVEEEIKKVAPAIESEAGDLYATVSLKENESSICAPATGSLTKIHVKGGELVNEGQLLFTMNAMKMEIKVTSESTGRISEILVDENKIVPTGSPVLILQKSP